MEACFMQTPLRCLAINCTLKASGPSSTQVLLDQAIEELQASGVVCSSVRAAALDIRPGVTDDEGEGDAWPSIRDDLLASDILLLGTPIWLGGPSSVCRRVLERCDAFISQTDDHGRMVTFGKVAGVVVTGNEDGAHNVIAQLYQGLADCGFTIPTSAASYWVGEAMGSVDYRDLDEPPEKVAETTRMMATNLVHVARLLEAKPYPPPGSSVLP
jgi:multimeric flavodoxin WrbA